MLISVVTVCYNSQDTIKATIESILKQTYDKIEYIIVDGLSTDDTLSIVESYREAMEKKGYIYRVVSEKDNGIYDAMNKGIATAQGELVALLNSDDWYEPCAVETVANTYKEEKFDMFFADINLIKKNGQVIVKHAKLDKRTPVSRHWNHPTSFITKQTYNELGVYRCEGLYDDFDLYLRIVKAQKKIVVKNVVLANFRVGGVSNQKSWKLFKQRCGYKYRCYRNNGYSRWMWFNSVIWEFAKLILS